MIISFILITLMFDPGLILLREMLLFTVSKGYNSLLDRGAVIVILRWSHNYNYGLFFKTLIAFLQKVLLNNIFDVTFLISRFGKVTHKEERPKKWEKKNWYLWEW